MINLFKKKKSTKEIIEEIHHSFYTEVDRLLEEANVMRDVSTQKNDLIEKAERLKKLGFGNTKEVLEAEKEVKRIDELQKENANKEHITKAINYFSFKYPNYKFITEDSIKKICSKYNLIYSFVDRYIGTVPNKNLETIEKFEIEDKDRAYLEKEWNWNGTKEVFASHYDYVTYKVRIESWEEEKNSFFRNKDLSSISNVLLRSYYASRPSDRNISKNSLMIAAPLKDFNIDKAEIKDFKLSNIEIPDPVVLQPVFFEGKQHFLIVTAWGDEASDELVVNQRDN